MPPKKLGKGARKAPQAHKLCDPLSAGTELNDVFKGKWRIGKPVGQGGFGLLYLATKADSSNKADAKYVIKVEPWNNGALFSELSFYQRVAKPEFIAQYMSANKLKVLGMPKYIATGSHEVKGEKMRFMVMERFGVDLQKKFVECQKKFSRKTVNTLAVQIIDILQYVHEKEYVHADIKAANLLLGHEKASTNQVYLVDYGLAFRYTVSGKHKDYKEDPRRCHDGTIEFTSIDAHNGVSPSRRGDLEILGYCLLQWSCSQLPWEDNLQNSDYVKSQKIKYMKNVPSLLKTCFRDSPVPDELQSYLQYVSKLKYDEKPNYDSCKKMFTEAMKKNCLKIDGKLDFSLPVAQPTPKKKATAGSSKRKAVTSPERMAHNVSQTSFGSDSDVSPPKRGRKAPAMAAFIDSPSTSSPATKTSVKKSPRARGARGNAVAATSARGTKRSLSPSPVLSNGRSLVARGPINSSSSRTATPGTSRSAAATPGTSRSAAATPGTSRSAAATPGTSRSAAKKTSRLKASVACQTSPGLKGLKGRRKK